MIWNGRLDWNEFNAWLNRFNNNIKHVKTESKGTVDSLILDKVFSSQSLYFRILLHILWKIVKKIILKWWVAVSKCFGFRC